MELKNLLKDSRIHILALVLLVLLAYVNSLPATFVSDDLTSIPNNPELGSFAYVLKHKLNFVQPFFYFTINKIFGPNPVAFRSVNIIFHIGTVVVIYGLLKHMWRSTPAFIAAAIFAVHPLLTESVTWISAGHYVKYGFFFLLSFYLYLKSVVNKKLYIGSLVSYFFALMSSPLAISLGPVLILYAFTQKKLKQEIKKIAPYFLIVIPYFILYALEVPDRISSLGSITYGLREVYNYNPLLLIPVALFTYLQLLFLPITLSFYHSEIISYTGVFVRSIFMLGYIALLVYFYKKNRDIFFWLAFFIVTLILVVSPIQISSASIGERYVYIAALGIIAPIAYLIYYLSKKNQIAAAGVFILILILLTGRTMIRNLDWRTYESFWLKTLETAPNSYQAHSNAGKIALERGDIETAIKEFQITIALVPQEPFAHYNLATVYYKLGYFPEAIEGFEKTISLYPQFVEAYQNMSSIYYAQKEFEKSEQYTLKAIQLDPNNPELQINLGIIYLAQGKKGDARQIFEAILKTYPMHPRAEAGLAESLK